jgi:hypothetical protein
MPIPTRADYQLAEIETASAGILKQLRVMQHAARTAKRSSRRSMISSIRPAAGW